MEYEPTPAERSRIVWITRKLEAARRRLARLERKRYPGDELREHFHLGMVGGSGRQSARLNRRKERAFDRFLDDNRTKIDLRARITAWESEIEAIQAGRRAQEQAERLARRKPKVPARPRRPRPAAPPFDYAAYNARADALYAFCEAQIQTVAGICPKEWTNLEGRRADGLRWAWITVQGCLAAAHMRPEPATLTMIQQSLQRERRRCEQQLADAGTTIPYRVFLQTVLTTITEIESHIEAGVVSL